MINKLVGNELLWIIVHFLITNKEMGEKLKQSMIHLWFLNEFLFDSDKWMKI